ALPIDGERSSRRDASGVGSAHHEGAEPPHFFLEQTDGVRERGPPERVRTDELAEVIGDLGRRSFPGLLLEETNRNAQMRELQRRLAAGETGPDDDDGLRAHGVSAAFSGERVLGGERTPGSATDCSVSAGASIPREYPHSLPRGQRIFGFFFPPPST